MKSTGNHSPNITVSPRSSLMDRKVKICISGLEAGQPVTLHASVVGDANEIFESHAHYVADREGKIFILHNSESMGPLQLGSRDHNFPKNLLYYGL